MKIINNILHRIKEDSLAKRSDGAVRVAEYKELWEIRSCLVFWVADAEQEVWLKKVAKKLDGVKIDKLCYIPKDYTGACAAGAVCVRNEELGFGGKILNDCLPEVLGRTYDLLIDLSVAGNGLVNYCLNHSAARCKTGMSKEGFEADIIIDEVSDPAVFIDTLFEVIANIKKY